MNKYDLEKLFRSYRRSFVEAKGEPLFLVVPSMTGLPTRTTVDKISWVRGICFDPALPPTWPELQAKTIEIFGQDCLPRSPRQWDRDCVLAGCSDLKLAPHNRPRGRPPTPPGKPSKKGWRNK
jgi:hypothetical protein